MGLNGHTLPGHLKPDLHGELNSWIHTWDTRTKTIAMVIFIFGIISIDKLNVILLAFSLVMIAALSTRIPPSFMWRRVKWVFPFLIFIFGGLLLGRGFENFQDSLYFASVVSLKALTSILATIMVLGSQSLEEFFKGLSELKVPQTIISVLFLSYRYIFLYQEVFNNTYKALLSRGFENKFSLHTLRVYGEIIGALFVKALDRSGIVFKSMEARGFDGSIPVVSNFDKLQIKDVLKTVAVIMVTAVLLSLDWGVI